MKKILILAFAIFMLIPVLEIRAQENKIVISQKTEVLDGKTFIIHTVKKGQTLYSLCKAYGVSQEDMLKNNPEAKNGLKEGQILRIPASGNTTSVAAAPKDTVPPKEFGYIFHKVKQGETLYRIMKKYEIGLKTLKEYNPGLSANLSIGQWIKIPTKDILIQKQAEQLYDSLVDYKLRRRDTYFRLRKKFGIDQAQMEQLNPRLKDTGLQKGMIIKIPYTKSKKDTLPQVIIEQVKDSIKPPSDSLLEKVIGCDSLNARNNTYKVALMMPFYSDLEKDIRVDNKYFMKEPSTYPSFRFIQYYEGFLMAVDSLEKQGLKADIYVYDTKADTAVTREITKKPEFEEMDLIIGPFFRKNLAIVAKEALKHNIKVVSPFSRARNLRAYPNLFITIPTRYLQMNQGIKFLSDSLSDASVYIIHNQKQTELQELSLIKNLIKKYSLSGNLDSNKVRIYNYKTEGFKKLMADLKPTGRNVVINLVDDEAYISSFVRQLNGLSDKYDIILMGTEDRWKKYKTLEDEYLVNLHLTLVSPGFINYSQNNVQIFAHKFFDKYKTDPNFMAFKGFDQSYYFLSLLYSFGSDFTPCMNKLKVNTLQNDFVFNKSAAGCWDNNYANIYQYNNFMLVDKKRRLIPYNPEIKADKDAKDKMNEKTENQER